MTGHFTSYETRTNRELATMLSVPLALADWFGDTSWPIAKCHNGTPTTHGRGK